MRRLVSCLVAGRLRSPRGRQHLGDPSHSQREIMALRLYQPHTLDSWPIQAPRASKVQLRFRSNPRYAKG